MTPPTTALTHGDPSEPGSRPFPQRRVVLVARPGRSGAELTFSTLNSLASGWQDVNEPWDVVVVATPDQALEQMLTSFSGDIEVRWDHRDLELAVEEVRGAGGKVHVITAGDHPPAPPTHPRPLIPLVDEMFAHQRYWNTQHETPDGSALLDWDRNFDPSTRHPLVVFTSLSVNRVLEHRASRKVAWLCESPEVYQHATAFTLANAHLFDLIVTNDPQIVDAVPHAELLPHAGCWISLEDQRIPEKTEWCSMVTSKKNFTSGHRFRLEVAERAKGVDMFGRGFEAEAGYREVEKKGEALLPYQYSIAVENCRVDTYFSEKIIDCFRTGTMPIYWGSPSIGDVFNMDGIIPFDDLSGFDAAMAAATPERYEMSRGAIEENYRIAEEFLIAENRLLPLLSPFLLRG